jgi:hypothetical protein
VAEEFQYDRQGDCEKDFSSVFNSQMVLGIGGFCKNSGLERIIATSNGHDPKKECGRMRSGDQAPHTILVALLKTRRAFRGAL